MARLPLAGIRVGPVVGNALITGDFHEKAAPVNLVTFFGRSRRILIADQREARRCSHPFLSSR